jgi:hypothetical protein
MPDAYLIDLGLATNSGQATKVFASAVPTLASLPATASEAVQSVWDVVTKEQDLSNNLRGSVFELLIGSVLVSAGCYPFFRQAEVTYVNNAHFDFLLWEDGWNPISISIKTSLRERYKQAELEAGALKNVHRRSENFLVTLAEDEVKARRRKLQETQQFSNLDKMVLADQPEFDELIQYLKSKTFALPGDINPMSNRYVVSR